MLFRQHRPRTAALVVRPAARPRIADDFARRSRSRQPRADISPGRSRDGARSGQRRNCLCDPYHTLHTSRWCILNNELPKGGAETTGAKWQYGAVGRHSLRYFWPYTISQIVTMGVHRGSHTGAYVEALSLAVHVWVET